MEKHAEYISDLPAIQDILRYCNSKGKIPVHTSLYDTFNAAVDEWFFTGNNHLGEKVVPNSDPILAALKEALGWCKNIVPVLVLWDVAKPHLCGKGKTQFESLYLSLKLRTTAALQRVSLTLGEQLLLRSLLLNPLFLGIKDLRTCSLSQIAACLSLPLQEKHLDGLEVFLEKKKEQWEKSSRLSLEEEILLGLLQKDSIEAALQENGQEIWILWGRLC